ncbi:MAG TPA: ATP-binding cassette domain-containing protein [Mycobacteriales bacterium]|nr:ATP-binding cassette domain-containing protein [Mycobacteriales bacterium]
MISAPAGGSRRSGLALLGVAQLLFFGLSFHNFLAGSNLTAIAQNNTDVLIAAIGTAALVISGNVDLSIGSQYALASVVTADVAVHVPAPVAVLAAIAVGLAMGAFNGLLVVWLSISPLIVTIAMLAFYRGLAFAISGGNPVVVARSGFLRIGLERVADVPVTVIVGLVVFAVGAAFLMTSVTGLRLYAVGGNSESARLEGLPVRRLAVATYAVNGALIGLVALLVSAQLGSGSANLGVDFEVSVLTAVILGGVAFTGGLGSPIGVFVGVAVLAILQSGLLFEGLASWYQSMAQGALLVLALAADQALARWRRAHAGRRDERPESAAAGEPRTAPSSSAEREREALLEVTGMTVGYGTLTALDQVDLVVRTGEVVCLVGDNGAGKSTLVKAVTGVLRPQAGSLRFAGEPLPPTAAEVRRRGIETVFQDLALFPNLSVADNVTIGLEPRRRLAGLLPVRDHAAATALATARLRSLGSTIDPRRAISELSGGQRQAVAIARVLRDDVRLVVLDEPTAALGARQTEEVLNLIRAAATAGCGVLLVTHDIEDVFEVGDSVVVLGRGRVVTQRPVAAMDRLELVRAMSGRE